MIVDIEDWPFLHSGLFVLLSIMGNSESVRPGQNYYSNPHLLSQLTIKTSPLSCQHVSLHHPTRYVILTPNESPARNTERILPASSVLGLSMKACSSVGPLRHYWACLSYAYIVFDPLVLECRTPTAWVHRRGCGYVNEAYLRSGIVNYHVK